MKNLKPILTGVLILFLCGSWGFWAHKKINYHAVFSLPASMMPFYKKHIETIRAKSTGPDKRRYADPEEACRHYMDADAYGADPFSIFPLQWDTACARFTEDTLKAYGIVPWHVQIMCYRLQQAFEVHDEGKIIFLSAELGHYMADACVPLHSTLNYNGQLTGQKGIHALWESQIPEAFGDDWNLMVGKATYIPHISKYVWQCFQESFSLKDSVLALEMALRDTFEADERYVFKTKKASSKKQYADDFIAAYHKALNGMVRRRMCRSIKAVADLWFTAWVNAGQPDLMAIKSPEH